MSGLDDFDRAPDDAPDLTDPAARLTLELCDRDNARRLEALLAGELLYVHGQGWLAWTGTHYEREAGAEVALGRASATLAPAIREETAIAADRPVSKARVEEAVAETGLSREEAEKRLRAERAKKRNAFAATCGNITRAKAALELARPLFRVPGDSLDADRDRMQVANGTLDLEALAEPAPEAEDAEERAERWRAALAPEARRDGRPTRVAGCAFDPEAECPGFRAFVARAMPDPVDRAYLQRCMGALLGGQRGEIALILLGQGGNGKSTLVKAIEGVLGGYAQPCRIELFAEHRGGGQGPTPEEAILPGARAYLAAEPDTAVTLSASAMKGLTGGNSRLAHAKGKDPFTWMPVGIPVLQMNRMMNVNDPSSGFWRRVFPIQFQVDLTALPESERVSSDASERMLRAERSGILNWMLEGWAEFRALGELRPPAHIMALKGSLRELADPVGAFLDGHCVTAPGLRVRTSDLHKCFRAWCEAEGNKPMGGKAFTAAMLARDWEKTKAHGIWYWQGLDLDEEASARWLGSDAL